MADETIYDIGDDVILQGKFTTKVNGVDTLTDPTGTPTCKVAQPDGTEVAVAGVAKISTGVYECTFTPAQWGDHWYGYKGLGAAKAAGEAYFHVRKPRVP